MLTAGATVPGGYYLDRDGFDIVAVNGRQGSLPGTEGQHYVRIPTPLALLAAPVLGVLSAVLIPLFALVAVVIRLVHVGRGGARHASRATSFALRVARWMAGAAAARMRRSSKRPTPAKGEDHSAQP